MSQRRKLEFPGHDGGTLAGGGWFWSPTARRFVNRPAGL